MIWERYLSAADAARFRQTGLTGPEGLGRAPALLVVDVSWSFAGDDPQADIRDSIRRWPNSCGREGWTAIGRIGALIGAARRHGVPVIYSTGRARADGWDCANWRWKNARTGEPPDIGGSGREGNGIVDAVRPAGGEIVFRKRGPSMFFGTAAATTLRRLNRDSVIVTGTTTSGCVRASAVDAFSHGFRVAVVSDGCFDRGEASHAVALFDMAMRYGTVMEAADAMAHMRALAAAKEAGEQG
ncbi:isochorismatase family protein [Roseovarius pacificus]|uniref:isochorismatase family protein n=1 Tax=Roseovarius pacificus TaxID=337701 RepID=UPI0040395BAF